MISTYTQSCPVIFIAGAINQIGGKVREFVCRKALCIYDRGKKRLELTLTVPSHVTAAIGYAYAIV